MLGDALAYPHRSDDWVVTMLIGGVLLLASFLILPAFVLLGYLLRVLRRVALGEVDTAPSFTQWGELTVDGIRVFFVSLVYVVAVSLPLFVLLALVGVTSQPGNGGALAGLFGLAFFVAGAVVVYAFPAALTNYAVEDSLGAAFDVETIREVVTSRSYFFAWLTAALVSLIGGSIASLLSVVLVGVFLAFYVQVSTYFLFAHGYARAFDVAAA